MRTIIVLALLLVALPVGAGPYFVTDVDVNPHKPPIYAEHGVGSTPLIPELQRTNCLARMEEALKCAEP